MRVYDRQAAIAALGHHLEAHRRNIGWRIGRGQANDPLLWLDAPDGWATWVEVHRGGYRLVISRRTSPRLIREYDLGRTTDGPGPAIAGMFRALDADPDFQIALVARAERFAAAPVTPPPAVPSAPPRPKEARPQRPTTATFQLLDQVADLVRAFNPEWEVAAGILEGRERVLLEITPDRINTLGIDDDWAHVVAYDAVDGDFVAVDEMPLGVLPAEHRAPELLLRWLTAISIQYEAALDDRSAPASLRLAALDTLPDLVAFLTGDDADDE